MKLYELFRRHPQVSTDSRHITADSLFFALHGDRFDGNRYAAAALDAGAAIAVVDDPAALHAAPARDRERCVLVPDTLKALQQLAAEHRRELGIPILAITGSNGKTTTKELVGRTLARKYRAAVTEGNLNNHIGVPLTLLSMDRTVQFGVVEMGANHQREIALLCSIAQPDFGLITNIGKAHLEGFGGIEGIMRGKGELFDYLEQHGGTAFWFAESDFLRTMVGARPGLKAIPYSTAGLSPAGRGDRVEATWDGIPVRTRLIGDYNLNNIAAAIAVGTHFGVGRNDIAAAIESYEPDNNRSQKTRTAHNTLISDYYNANPTSMRAAIENFLREPGDLPKAVILADMGELGDYSAAEHEAIVDLLGSGGVAEAYLVGRHFSAASAGRYPAFADTDALDRHLEAHPLRERLILIKGSRTNHLETIVKRL